MTLTADRPTAPATERSAVEPSADKRAVLYRMAGDGHLCPFGVKSRDLLKRRGYEVEDHTLTSRAEVDAFKAEHDVKTTPQTFIGGRRVGGYDALLEHFGIGQRPADAVTYAPVIAIFATTALMALAITVGRGAFEVLAFVQWFVAFSMCALAIQKLRDLDGFVNGFLGYDLLAQKMVRYGYAYPFLEAYVGIGMIALIGTGSPLVLAVAPVGLFIGTVGAVSVIKAVYVDRRDLKCACVGGGSNVPLGAISLTENLMMASMGAFMLATFF